MQNKKLASIIALTAVVANLGVASVAFAQSTSSTTGTQPINCSELSSNFATRVPTPANFAFASRQVSNNYDNFVSDSYFGGDDQDLTDLVGITSNTPVSCASETRSVTLQVQAESPFYYDADNSTDFNLDDVVLANVGSDNTFNTSDDIAAILSISHGAVTCNVDSPASCTSANNTTNYGAQKDGSTNYFDGTANDGTVDNGYDANLALLTPQDNYDKALTNSTAAAPVTIFSSPMGYDGEVTVQNISFKIALPANIEVPTIANTGVDYTTNVVYSIS